MSFLVLIRTTERAAYGFQGFLPSVPYNFILLINKGNSLHQSNSLRISPTPSLQRRTMPCGLSFRRKPDPEPDWEDNLGTILRDLKGKADDRTAAINAKLERNRARYEREDREEERERRRREDRGREDRRMEDRRREDRRREDRDRPKDGEGRRGERTERDRRRETSGRQAGPKAVGGRRDDEMTHAGRG
ncbi:MAG: hypothetical protein Q9192_005309 [Flavoplaca navasiana]